MIDFKRKVAKSIKQADGRMVLSVLACGHEVYGLKPDATDHLCGQCARENRAAQRVVLGGPGQTLHAAT